MTARAIECLTETPADYFVLGDNSSLLPSGVITVNEIFHLARCETPTGRMLLVTDDQERLRALDWEDHESRMRLLFRRQYPGAAPTFSEAHGCSAAQRALESYFDGDLDAIRDVPTATGGTEFQRLVWAALRSIPTGATLSYGGLAARLGRPAASRAVGLANGANPIAIVVPCHRVIGANASLTGYGGGLDRKRWLLAHESQWNARAAAVGATHSSMSHV